MIKIRKANLDDIADIQNLVNYYANRDEMLPKSLSVLYENVRDFFVAIDENEVFLGCCAAHVAWGDLAEIKSLAVREDLQGSGIGRLLVESGVKELAELGVKKVFALTYSAVFFGKLGFRVIDKKELPQKIWSECIYCPKFPDCGEEAVMVEL